MSYLSACEKPIVRLGVLFYPLGKLDLVTREEFEVQEAVLARTRQKLEALEERLISIETAKATSKKKKTKKTNKKKAKAKKK